MLTDLQIIKTKEYVNQFLIEHFNMTLEILNSNRNKTNAYTRMSMYRIFYYKFDFTYVDIGKIFNRHHTTVMYGVQSHRDLIKYPDFKNCFEKANLLNPDQLIIDESKYNNRLQFTV